MLRAFFRRLPLAASLVVLLTISLSSVVPTQAAFAKSTAAHCKGNTDSFGQCHLGVAATVTPPPGTEGAYGVFDQYHPKVDSVDELSLAQIAITDGIHMVEVGWISRPNIASSVIFVNVRDNINLPTGGTSCYVQKVNGSWTCGFTSFSAFNTTGYYPGHSVDPKTQALIYLLNTETDIYIQYGNDWLGKITNTYWLSGSFGPVTLAQWQGEVAVKNQYTTHTEMGDGTCGSAPGSAGINSMTWFVGESGSGTFQPVNAPQSSITADFSYDYNSGHPNGNSFTYGGPGAHIPPCL
jgi:hypothetical protein